MENKPTLYSLFENNKCDSSNIIYYNGSERYSINYNELHDSVNFIVQLLSDLSLSEKNIFCLIRPGLALPAVILGISKVSSAFAFLDDLKPVEKLQDFQRYVEVKTLLIEDYYLKELQSKLCSCWKAISKFHKFTDFTILQSSECKDKNCPNTKQYIKPLQESEVAYYIRTSGTTGDSKVIQVPRDCIMSNIVDFRSRFSITHSDVILQATKLTFDPSIIEIFLALSSGASLVLAPDHVRNIPQNVMECIVNENVTIFQTTPSFIYYFGEYNLKNVLLSNESSLRILTLNGEPCPSIHKLRRWKSEHNKTDVYNLYGLTELSCYASCFKIDFDNINFESSVPIGEPLLDTKLEIRNETGEIADEGEMYMGGGSKRFCLINDEKIPDDLENFLRPTGDLMIKCSDGFTYFESRTDDVITYMGHKISQKRVNDTVEKFTEITNHFLHYDSVSDSLYLFITTTLKPSCERQIKEKLLKSMKDNIPNLPPVIIVPIPFVPWTKHGKRDIKNLMKYINETQKKINYSEDVSDKDIDDKLSSLWKTYTNQEVILDNDSFIEKGGHTNAALELSAEIEWHFQLQLPLLVEKIRNKFYKDVKEYVISCVKEDMKPVKIHQCFRSEICV